MNEADVKNLPKSIRNKSDYLLFLKADLEAHGLKKWRADYRFRNPPLHYQRTLRKVEYLHTRKGIGHRILRIWTRFWLQRQSLVSGISIPPGVFGPGLSIAHYGSIVVNSGARVGAFCRIHSATNIGTAAGGIPTLGDLVYVGPGAILYGAVTVGDRVVVGANAVVNKDVKAGVTVAGAPARVISQHGSEKIMPQWFPNAPVKQELPG